MKFECLYSIDIFILISYYQIEFDDNEKFVLASFFVLRNYILHRWDAFRRKRVELIVKLILEKSQQEQKVELVLALW